jgi:hypothetical protein
MMRDDHNDVGGERSTTSTGYGADWSKDYSGTILLIELIDDEGSEGHVDVLLQARMNYPKRRLS